MVDIVKQDMTHLWAISGDVIAPDNTKIEQGWAVEVVPRQWWNWMQYRADSNIAYMLQKGIPEWDSTTEYLANKSFVTSSGIVYKCLITNTNLAPVSNPLNWVRAFSEYSVAVESLGSVTPSADTMPYFTGSSSASTTPLTAFARTLLDDTSATQARATLSAQESNQNLTALSGVTAATNSLPYFNGTSSMATTNLSAFGRTLIDDADATAARATLSVYSTAQVDSAISVSAATKQPLDATLTTLAALTTAVNTMPYFTGVDTAATTPLTAFARTILDDVDAASVRSTIDAASNADLTTGLDGKQPLDATLTGLAGVTTAADRLIYATGVDTFTVTSFTGAARTLVSGGSFAAMRTTLDVPSNSDLTTGLDGKQPLSANLTSLAALVTAADTLPYFSSVNTVSGTTLSPFARTLLDDVNAAASRTTLGLGTSATSDAATANTPSTVVLRDASGNFSAGAVTATSFSGSGAGLTTLSATNITTGTLAVARGGTGATATTGSGNNVLSASPVLTGTPTAPTAPSGTNTDQLATTAFVAAAVTTVTSLFTREYVSAELDITSGPVLPLAHNFGVRPRLATYTLKCITAQAGYVAGDELDVSGLMTYPGSNLSGGFVIKMQDVNTAYVKINGGNILLNNGTDGSTAVVNITRANWVLVVRLYA